MSDLRGYVHDFVLSLGPNDKIEALVTLTLVDDNENVLTELHSEYSWFLRSFIDVPDPIIKSIRVSGNDSIEEIRRKGGSPEIVTIPSGSWNEASA